MPVIQAVFTPPVDVMAAISDQMMQSPTLMATAYKRSTARLKSRLLTELRRTPGAPVYPIRWKTARQRRAFFASNGFGRGIPTQRNGALQAGWTVTVLASNAGGAFTVENDVPYASFVEGAEAQPFHLITGWPQAYPLIAEAAEELTEVLIQTWYTVADPFAGVRG